jgi:hypothetical protein
MTRKRVGELEDFTKALLSAVILYLSLNAPPMLVFGEVARFQCRKAAGHEGELSKRTDRIA